MPLPDELQENAAEESAKLPIKDEETQNETTSGRVESNLEESEIQSLGKDLASETEDPIEFAVGDSHSNGVSQEQEDNAEGIVLKCKLTSAIEGNDELVVAEASGQQMTTGVPPAQDEGESNPALTNVPCVAPLLSEVTRETTENSVNEDEFVLIDMNEAPVELAEEYTSIEVAGTIHVAKYRKIRNIPSHQRPTWIQR